MNLKTEVNRFAMTVRGALGCIASAAALLSGIAAHAADAWPAKPIRIVVPVPAGSATDLTARQLAPRLAQELGQPVVIDNKPGADMGIGIVNAAKSPADGYTWLLVSSTLTSSAVLKKVAFDPAKDFAPVSLIGYAATVAVVPPALGVKTLDQFVALAKSKPGALNYANPAVGALGHLNTALLAHATGIDMTSVIYKGSSPAMVDLVSNRVHFMMMPTGVALPQTKGGTLLALGVVGDARSPLYPNVPTLKELGYPSVDLEAWMGILMPAGTPREIVLRANAALNTALKEPAIKDAMEQAGLRVTPGGTPEAFAQQIRKDAVQWPKIFELAKIKRED
ncbi:MAG: tripartite tricarboxylate transporter substrate binding protein [Pseudomonadota bacterium]